LDGLCQLRNPEQVMQLRRGVGNQIAHGATV
jgi:hypothetical protein